MLRILALCFMSCCKALPSARFSKHRGSAIRQYLGKALSELQYKRFGRSVLPAVLVQLEQLRSRLFAFADWQAKWAAEGWETKFSELAIVPQTAWLPLSVGRMGISGRIDRLDFNRLSGDWALLDYKSGDNPKKPLQAHQQNGAWIDLQLPLYHYLIATGKVAALGHEKDSLQEAAQTGKLLLGYLQLPKSAVPEAISLAKWSLEELSSAQQEIFRVAEAVAAGVFWPPTEIIKGFSEFVPLFAGAAQEIAFD